MINFRASAYADKAKNIKTKHTLSSGFSYYFSVGVGGTATMFVSAGASEEEAVQGMRNTANARPDLIFSSTIVEPYIPYPFSP